METKNIEPYAAGMIKGNPYDRAKRRKLEGKIVALMDVMIDNRGYRLIAQPSRAVSALEIHELITTSEQAGPGGVVNDIGVIGFMEFTFGGIIAVGDRIVIGQKEIGEIAGFDETHFPNHINIIIKTPERISGFDINGEVEESVSIYR